MPLVRQLYRAALTYEAPKDLSRLSDMDLASEYELSWMEGKLKAHRAVSAEIARRDPTARRATPRA